MTQKEIREVEQSFTHHHLASHDACGIVAIIQKNGIPTQSNIEKAIGALTKMNHRAGFINGEGDGVGIHTDIPKKLWGKKLTAKNVDAANVDRSDFSVAHIFLTRNKEVKENVETITHLFQQHGFKILTFSTEETNTEALGPIAKSCEPIFIQISFIAKEKIEQMHKKHFALTLDLEENPDIHVASLSRYHAVYKVLGAGETLKNYYKDLQDPDIASRCTLGHNRYSTNTLSNFFRVQPFCILGHNGEINTISKLRDEARMLGFTLTNGGSDSQDLSRTIQSMMIHYDFSLLEAMEFMFPPIYSEIKAEEKHIQDLYAYMREAWGHFAQGPAGIISRYKDETCFSLDALGLRPQWMLETEDCYMFSSEQGIELATEYISEPKPLAPGEKVALLIPEGKPVQVLDHHEIQETVYQRLSPRIQIQDASTRLIHNRENKPAEVFYVEKPTLAMYEAFGWNKEHLSWVEQTSETGNEPIRGLGHDLPLAALDTERKNLADFMKETVAVVTNPAIDREREMEHFSTRSIIGARPSLHQMENEIFLENLRAPLLIEGQIGASIAHEIRQPSYETLLQTFETKKLVTFLDGTRHENENMKQALRRLSEEAVSAVQSGYTLLILDDAKVMEDKHYWMDPTLAVAIVNFALIKRQLRRKASIILRSAALRNLHDIAIVCGLGADAVSPYFMFASAKEYNKQNIMNLWNGLQKGIEKVISTLGIFEFRGYTRLFSSIGLADELAKNLRITNYFGSKQSRINFEYMEKDSLKRKQILNTETKKLAVPKRILTSLMKPIHQLSQSGDYEPYREVIAKIEEERPSAIRHLLDFHIDPSRSISQEAVSLKTDIHELPFVIGSMSFGSQNEIPFRAYAEAAYQLNMLSINGEGGEIFDMLGKYPYHRGIQVASGRFGVNAEILNSSHYIELKVGQGAKPGEGGHLPAEKVNDKIALARFATKGSDLISPSNNHDIYSIEDLAQIVAELKAVNDQARIIVKVPIVPNIGTIAIGVAKSGADIISLSGFDGGTGAARAHATAYVGLPAEIGVKAAHQALLEAGLRENVEIWADGGVKSADDVMKLILLGANRIGFATLAMMSVGCTTCRSCFTGTCHVGITSQIDSVEEATALGLRRYQPRQFEQAVENLKRLFTGFAEGLKTRCAELGFTNIQDAVGKSEYLIQTRGHKLLDLTTLQKEHELQNTFCKVNYLPMQNLFIAHDETHVDYNVDALLQNQTVSSVNCEHRAVGARVAGHRVRGKLDRSYLNDPAITRKYTKGSIPGNGFGAYNVEGITLIAEGGAEDGVGKTAHGGNIYVLKTKNKFGKSVGGSVGKGFGYGAQKGKLYIQGNADARAGIRLSGADMIIGGQIEKPLYTSGGLSFVESNIKGFAFEYMTGGRALVLGDPGPWLCSGMTGGVVYLRIQEEMGLTVEVLKKRLAKGAAKVELTGLSEKGMKDVKEMLNDYLHVLTQNNQAQEADTLRFLTENPDIYFVQIQPVQA